MVASNAFKNDLGTGLTHGSEVGCKVFSGLTALSGMRIKCLLSVGTNQTNKPTIRIINYNFINAATTIKIGFAGLQSLPAVLSNTISIGSKIFYTNIKSETYLYIPTPVVTVPTIAYSLVSDYPAGWHTSWFVNMTYSSTNVVLRPTQFLFSFKVPYLYFQNNITGNWMYDYRYTSTGAEDEFILLTFYPASVLDRNNPLVPVCDATSFFSACLSVDVYYASGTVRIRHNTVNGGSDVYRHFRLSNFPTSAYNMLNQLVVVRYQLFDGYRVIFDRNISVSPERTV